jgi:hypothetical protein
MSDDNKIIKKNLFTSSNSSKNTQNSKAVKTVKVVKAEGVDNTNNTNNINNTNNAKKNTGPSKTVKQVNKNNKTSASTNTDKTDKTDKTDIKIKTEIVDGNNIEKIKDSDLLRTDIVLNDDLLDMLEGMTDKLEETSNMAEKIKLHSEIQNSTSRIKALIDMLIDDVDNIKIREDPANIYADDFIDTDSERFDILTSVHNLETDLSKINKTDDLIKQVEIYKNLQRKCEVLKNAANNGDLIIKKCN